MQHARRLALVLGPDGFMTAVALVGLALLALLLGGKLQLVIDSVAPLVVLGALLVATALPRLPALWKGPDARRRFLDDQVESIRVWAPFVLLYVCYRALRGTMNVIVTHGGVQDQLKALDEALFGISPSWWMEKFATPWLTELMSYGYALMFVLPMAILLLLQWRGRKRDFREVALSVLVAFYVGFAIYLLVPAKSPRVVYEYATQLHGFGLYEVQQIGWDKLQMITFDAFPSLHTTISTIALAHAWKFGPALSAKRPRLLFWIFLPHVVLLQLSTLYLRQHYFVDLVGGWALGAFSVWISARLVTAWSRLGNCATLHAR